MSAQLKRFRQPGPVSVAVALAVFLAVSALTEMGLLQPVELAAYDTLLRLRPEQGWTEPRITVVRVTDEDIRRIGHWPMHDDVLADILDAAFRGEPRAVGLDLYRDLLVPPGSERLEALLRARPNFVAVEKFLAVDGSIVPPPPTLAGTEQIGFADLVLDRGGSSGAACCFSTTASGSPTRSPCGSRCSISRRRASARSRVKRIPPICASAA